jgi:hypothetical protein
LTPDPGVPRPTILRQVQALDPVADHQRITFLSTCYDFPFDTTRALEFALFRTFCVPRVAGLLDSTGEFTSRAQKRYDDTDLLVSELIEHGYESERGRRALRRINELHGKFAIANDDFLYVLSTFVYEPIRWNASFGWRPLCEQERLGYFHFWKQVGRRMDIRDVPEDYDAFERFNRAYEKAHFRPNPASARVGAATRDMFLSWFPRPVRPLARSAMYALMDEPMRTTFGFPAPSPLARRLVPALLRVRARLLRWLPRRRSPRLRTAGPNRTYPRGYVIEQLGPP